MANETNYGDFLEQALQAEMAARTEHTRQTLQKLATLPSIKTLEAFDFGFAAGISKPQVMELASLTFIERAENVVLLCPSDVGKTHLAIALAMRAAHAGIKTRFLTTANLMLQLASATARGAARVLQSRHSGSRLLIVDELVQLRSGREEASLFFNVVSKRYERGSMILTSNLPFPQWTGALADDATLTASLLDCCCTTPTWCRSPATATG